MQTETSDPNNPIYIPGQWPALEIPWEYIKIEYKEKVGDLTWYGLGTENCEEKHEIYTDMIEKVEYIYIVYYTNIKVDYQMMDLPEVQVMEEECVQRMNDH